jgi:hypothetical protein
MAVLWRAAKTAGRSKLEFVLCATVATEADNGWDKKRREAVKNKIVIITIVRWLC